MCDFTAKYFQLQSFSKQNIKDKQISLHTPTAGAFCRDDDVSIFWRTVFYNGSVPTSISIT